MASAATKLTLSECTINTKTHKDYEFPGIIAHVNVSLRHPQLGDVASLHALCINRDMIRFWGGDFLKVMDEDSSETQEFSATIFDNKGNVKRHLVQKDAFRSGTGVWGEEMNVGCVVYIKEMYVGQQFRSQGAGSYILQDFLGSNMVPEHALVYCWPSPVRVRDRKEFDRLKAKQISFFRKNNFRRVGRTAFFAYSPNPNHPSRLIPISADVDSLIDTFLDTNSESGQELSVEEKVEKYPLHAAIANCSSQDNTIANVIEQAYAADPSSIHKRDFSGFTPLYVAAVHEKPIAVRKLLTWDMSSDLKDCLNVSGMMPLEALMGSMDSTKEFAFALLGKWKGYPESGLTVEYLLKVAMGVVDEKFRGLGLEEYVVRRKYGCTCGECAGGWLSPRMRYQLQCQADVAMDNMAMELEPDNNTFTPRRPLSPSSISILYNADFIPPYLYPSFYKTFYSGYQAIFRATSSLLADPTSPALSVENVLNRLAHLTGDFNHFQSDARYYLEKGGKVEYVFDAITHGAREQKADGRLGRCANDEMFGMVREMCGVGGSVRGPYYPGRDEGMDEDDEEDEMEEEF